MADQPTASHRDDPRQQQSASGNVGVYSPSEATDTFQSTTKSRMGVYDRPERTFGSWSPMTLIPIILVVLLLLWALGIFDYLLK